MTVAHRWTPTQSPRGFMAKQPLCYGCWELYSNKEPKVVPFSERKVETCVFCSLPTLAGIYTGERVIMLLEFKTRNAK